MRNRATIMARWSALQFLLRRFILATFPYFHQQLTAMMLFAKYLHILSFTVWVGGMFFAYLCLRPVAGTTLQPPARLTLWSGVLHKFFAWVWLAIVLILCSGLLMMSQMGKPPTYVSGMAGIGVLMMLMFAHVFFAPFRRLKRAVAAEEWSAGGAALAQIRLIVGINLILGLIVVTLGALGPLLA